ncbi:LPS export ABC transporter permease LptG [Wenzhouxiangella sp. XN79A]|uniref:LPS export ABC transporter permease LptG n=1 Tax=Wenzhouxiangella sp. XN79A TaxID=2724193 RepID=UPI00144ADEFC|nr:LPS export ABC transporter permease LptG [Wenzhouxiangella sp. XN79A]NKI35055.1 LPS export ABC transporter permease LptG [Wenzhouxiangella sp. XN79A]
MPGRLTRYLLARTVLGVLGVSLLLVGLYAGIDVVREAGDLQRDYDVPEMLVFVARTLPTRVYDIFPFAALIGVLVGLGQLAAQRELVAMRAAGMDRAGIALRAAGAALALALAVMAMAEFMVPRLDAVARIDREQARTGSVGSTEGAGLWLRDGSRMIHVGLLLWTPEARADFADLNVYIAAADGRPVTLVRAEGGTHDGRSWRLERGTRLDLDTGRVEPFEQTVLPSALNPDVFDALATRPRLLPIDDILRIRSYLEANALDAGAYEEAFWRRVLYPINLLAMVLIGLPLLFRPGRQASTAVNVFVGVALGVGFVVVQRISLGLAPVLPVPLGVTHALPALLFGGAAYALLRRG